MGHIDKLITDNLDIWTGAIKKRGSQGRGSNKKIVLYGIKKLRELILDLAVRGLLVPQDPNDEPASVLLERIAAEKERLVSEENLKTKAKLDFDENDKYLNAPLHWQWARLGNLAKFIDYRGKTPNKIGSGIRLITAKNVRFGYLDLNPEEFISLDEYKIWMTRGFPKKGDLLFTPEAPLGNIAKIDLTEKFALAQRAICFQFHLAPIADFLRLFIMAPLFQEMLKSEGTGVTAQGIKASKLKDFLIPLPPLEEQYRLVAKVDELMALCDQLEQQTENSLTHHQTLVETLLNALTEALATRDVHGAAAFQDAWQRIADNFDVLFTTEHAIEKLKQTILQLAVMGKLVAQDPNDEPASVLLERIAVEKERLVKEGKMKKQKPLPAVGEDEKPFELPGGWEWVRFDDIVEIGSGVTKGRKFSGRETIHVPYLRVANVQRNHLILDEIKEIEIGVDEINKYRVCIGDLLITEGGDADKVGRTSIWQDELDYVAHQNHVFKARRILKSLNVQWLEKYLNSQPSRDYFAGSSKQTTNLASINKTQLRGCLIAIPATKEQHRIVAKVDELMALCDQLKAQLVEAQSTQLHLTDELAKAD